MQRDLISSFYILHFAFCILLCLSRSSVLLAAPPTPSTQTTSPAGEPIDRNHHLGPGDAVEISVNGREEFSRTVRLFSDGTFDFPLLGTVQAAGLTVNELAVRITEGLKSELRRPVVSVLLRDVYIPPNARVAKITVLGAVTTKGEIDLPEPKPLRTLLAQVGPTDKADLAGIRVRYPDGSARTADFSRFNLTGQAGDDFLLKGGEEVIVLERPATQKPDPMRVTVLGAVQKPGSFEVEGGTTILELLEKAGGAKPGADLEKVEVKGPTHAQPLLLNVERYLDGDTMAGYVAQRSDVVVVPERPLRVLVLGEVGKPGELPIRENARLLDVYLQAGIAQNGDASRAQLIRRGADGKPVSRMVNIREIMKGKDRDNQVMRAGDVLFIPNRKGTRRTFLDYLGAVVSPLWLLGNFARH